MLEHRHDPLAHIDGELVRQVEDAALLDVIVPYGGEEDDVRVARQALDARLEVREDAAHDRLVKRQVEVKPVVSVDLRRELRGITPEELDAATEVQALHILLRDGINVRVVLDAADALEAVVEERDERAALAAAEVEDAVPPPVDKRGICPAWGKSPSVSCSRIRSCAQAVLGCPRA